MQRPPSQADAAPQDTAPWATRLDSAGAGLASLGIAWNPTQWATESAALQAALGRGAAASTRASGGKSKGGARTPTKKDCGKALQAALNDLDAAIKQWNAAAMALEQRTAQIAAGEYAVPTHRQSPEASSPAAPEGRRATKLPPKFAQFETEAGERRAGKEGSDAKDGRGGKRQRKLPTWLAKDHDIE